MFRCVKQRTRPTEVLGQVVQAALPDGRKAGPQHQESGISLAARYLSLPRIIHGAEADGCTPLRFDTNFPLYKRRGEAYNTVRIAELRQGVR